MRYLSFLVVILTFLLTFTDYGYPAAGSVVDTGLSPSNHLQTDNNDKSPMPQDPYVKTIAARFGADAAELEKLWRRGYGRNELIKLLVISLKSKTPLNDLVKDREKKARLSELCGKYGLSYRDLLAEAASIRKEIDTKAAVISLYDSSMIVKTSSGTRIIFSSTHSAGPVTPSSGTVGTAK